VLGREAGASGIQTRSGAEAAARLQQWASRAGRGGYSASLQSAYHETVAVYRCANVIARSVARAPLEVYSGEDLIESGPIVELMQRPNPYMTQARFVETLAVQTLIGGNGFIRPEDGALSGETLWLLLVPPQQVSPIRDQGNPYALKGWKIQSRGGAREFGPLDLVHIPYAPDPNDPILGVSPVGVAKLVVESDFDAALYNQSILKNSGNLSGILKWLGEDPLTEEEVSALSQRWNDNYAGADRAGKTAVLSGNFEFQSTSMSIKDMQYLEARRWNLADIARAFNVPLVFLNEFESSGLSDAGLRVQERMLYWQTVIPFARQIEQALTEFVRRRFRDERVSLVFNFDKVEALGEETSARLDQAQKLANLGYPVNLINETLELGLPEVPWGNEAFVPAGMMTATATVALSELPDDPIDVTPSQDQQPPTAPPAIEPPASVSQEQIQQILDKMTQLAASIRAAEVTDFPRKGDDLAVSLRNSQFDQFDHEWALDLKENYPDIWDAGGNIRGDEAFEHWSKVRQAGGRPETPAQEDWVREREAWMARHEGDGSQFSDESLSPTLSNVAGIIAVIKWGGIATIGESRMKEVLNDLKRKLDGPSDRQVAVLDDAETERRAALWRAIDRRSIKPYRAMLGAVRKALLTMRRQALEALNEPTRSFTRAEDPDEVAGAIDTEVLLRAIRKRFIDAFAKSYEDAFADISIEGDDSILFALNRPEVNKIAESFFDRGLGRVVEIGERIRQMVTQTLVAGQIEGENLLDLSQRVRDVFNASAARATTIARTETQIALNGGAQERYKRQMPNGKIQWLSSRDSVVRELHREVDGEVVILGAVFSNGLEHPCDPSGPPEEIINCRCYTIPLVEGLSEPEPQWTPDDE